MQTPRSLILLLLVLILNTSTKAQNFVTLNSPYLSAFSFCPLPTNVSMTISGTAFDYSGTVDVMTINVFWGDGTDTTFTNSILDSVAYDLFVNTISHNYSLPGTFSPMVIATAPDGMGDTVYTSPITLAAGCSNFNGYTYIDNNANCIYDAGDNSLPSTYVKVTDALGNFIASAYSDAMGHYSFTMGTSPAVYTVTAVNMSSYMGVGCPVTGEYTVSASGDHTMNFGMVCLSTNADYYIHHTGFCGYGPPGGYGEISLTSGVGACLINSYPATITVTLDPLVTYTGTMFHGPPPTTIADGGSTLIWNTSLIPSSVWGSGFNVSFETFTSTTAVVLSSTCFDLDITGPATDVFLYNNNEHTCLTIGGPYDPNNKEVLPAGIGATGNVAPETQFNYLINFQNCGTAEAINIYIMDTLDTDLDMNTFQVTGASHFMNPIINGNIVRFDFPGIHLIDSVANEPLSHGWVTYTVKAKSGLANGTTIENTGYIYFDYNAAVVTNTTLNTIDIGLGLKDIVVEENNALYPNPATTNFTLRLDHPVNGNLRLTDASGRIVKSIVVNESKEITVNIQDLPNGIYALSLPGVVLKQNRIQVMR